MKSVKGGILSHSVCPGGNVNFCGYATSLFTDLLFSRSPERANVNKLRGGYFKRKRKGVRRGK